MGHDLGTTGARAVMGEKSRMLAVDFCGLTFNTPLIDIEARRPILGNRQGGLSGPAIKPIALLKVHQVYEVCRPHGVPIIGQGGIASAADAIEFLLAGATAVGIGTALFYDPLICPTVNAGIVAYLEHHRIPSVSDLIGSLELQSPVSAWCSG